MKFKKDKKADLSGRFQNMWYPGFDYVGRTGEYSKPVSEVDVDDIVKLVQGRAQADGEWNIVNGFVGDNEDAMRKMMAWVSDEKNIRRAFRAFGVRPEHERQNVCDDGEGVAADEDRTVGARR